jgi:hypothetical protein
MNDFLALNFLTAPSLTSEPATEEEVLSLIGSSSIGTLNEVRLRGDGGGKDGGAMVAELSAR